MADRVRSVDACIAPVRKVPVCLDRGTPCEIDPIVAETRAGAAPRPGVLRT